MRHRKYEELIVLSHYEEIAGEDKAVLENHLKSCTACADFAGRTARFFPRPADPAEAKIDRIVDQARNELRGSLTEGSRRRRGAGRITAFRIPAGWRSFSMPTYAAAAAAVVMFAVGIVSGYLFHNVGGTQAVISDISRKNSGDVAITDVRFLKLDKTSGDVKFSFNLVRRYEMDGSLEEGYVQKILAYALVNSDNPGVRLRTIGLLDATPKPDTEIERALIKAVKTDDNAGVRREALLSLEKLPFDNSIKEALLYVLQHDKNPGMRVAAINSLAQKDLGGSAGGGTDPGVLRVLREKSSSDRNKYVRLKAADMLKEMKEL